MSVLAILVRRNTGLKNMTVQVTTSGSLGFVVLALEKRLQLQLSSTAEWKATLR